VVTREVDGWHRVFMTVAATSTRGREDTERPTQQGASLANFSVRDELADLATGDVMSAAQLFGINNGFEAHLLAERAQRVHIALRFVAKVKVVALVNFARVQASRKHI